jgi:hypothetical protein
MHQHVEGSRALRRCCCVLAARDARAPAKISKKNKSRVGVQIWADNFLWRGGSSDWLRTRRCSGSTLGWIQWATTVGVHYRVWAVMVACVVSYYMSWTR